MLVGNAMFVPQDTITYKHVRDRVRIYNVFNVTCENGFSDSLGECWDSLYLATRAAYDKLRHNSDYTWENFYGT